MTPRLAEVPRLGNQQGKHRHEAALHRLGQTIADLGG
jgi:hypothetical protein